MWATDATKIFTIEDGWVHFFGIIEHWNAECLGWHLTKRGDRFAAIEALAQAVNTVFGHPAKDAARGLHLRVDHGSQFLSEGFVNQARYWGIALSKGYVREPQTNGVVERFHRTFKEQVVYGRHFRSTEDLREAVKAFIDLYNREWLLEKLKYRSPMEARKLMEEGVNLIKTPQISPMFQEGEEEHGYSVLAARRDVEKEGKNFAVSFQEEEEHGYSVLAVPV
jgi:transposase InsO family protein